MADGWQIASGGSDSNMDYQSNRHLFYDSTSSTWFAVQWYGTSGDWYIYKWDGTSAANSWTRQTDADAAVGTSSSHRATIYWVDSSRTLYVFTSRAASSAFGALEYYSVTYTGSDAWTQNVGETAFSSNSPSGFTRDHITFTVANDGIPWVSTYDSNTSDMTFYYRTTADTGGGSWTDSTQHVGGAGGSMTQNNCRGSLVAYKNSSGNWGVGMMFSDEGGSVNEWRWAARLDSAGKTDAWSDTKIYDAVTSVDDHSCCVADIEDGESNSTVWWVGKDQNDVYIGRLDPSTGSWSTYTLLQSSGSQGKVALDITNGDAYFTVGDTTGLSSFTKLQYYKVTSALSKTGPTDLFTDASPASGDWGTHSVPSHGVDSDMNLVLLGAYTASSGYEYFNVIAIAGGGGPAATIHNLALMGVGG